jgi:hypothetical protein
VRKQAKVGDEGRRHPPDDTTLVNDMPEIELEIEHDDNEHKRHQAGEADMHRRKSQRSGDSVRVKGGTTGNTMTPPPILLVSEAQNGHSHHGQLPAIHDDHLAHLYSDLAAAEHLSLVRFPQSPGVGER